MLSGRLVLFDFDGTLTHTDSTLAFARLLDNRGIRCQSPLIAGALVAARFKCLTNHQLKHCFARLLLAGRTLSETTQLAQQFLIAELPGIVDEHVLTILQRHAAEGDAVHVVSANFSVLLEPLRSRWPISGIIATDTEIRDGRLTGALAGAACHGAEKLRRVTEAFGAEAVRNAIAYGDSRGDRPLLGGVGQGYLVERARVGQSVLRPFRRRSDT